MATWAVPFSTRRDCSRRDATQFCPVSGSVTVASALWAAVSRGDRAVIRGQDYFRWAQGGWRGRDSRCGGGAAGCCQSRPSRPRGTRGCGGRAILQCGTRCSLESAIPPSSPLTMPRQIFVTTALPYANGHFHIGHIMEYIQADIWVRFQRMRGHQVHFVGADDAHGAPIMIAAEKAGKTPQQFVADIAAARRPDLNAFHISFHHWSSTDSPENHALSQEIYLALKAAGFIKVKPVEQFFDPDKGMFLPDRFIKGECPKCGAKDQYGDSCEVCGAVYAP